MTTPASTDQFITIIDRIEQFMQKLGENISMPEHEVKTPQALIIVRMEEGREYNVGYIEASLYFGTNVSYNINKLHDMGYLSIRKSADDKRMVYVSLSPRGVSLKKKLLLKISDCINLSVDEANGVSRTLRHVVSHMAAL
jgi:DNA-binding MarR family transcriptional regulator